MNARPEWGLKVIYVLCAIITLYWVGRIVASPLFPLPVESRSARTERLIPQVQVVDCSSPLFACKGKKGN